jgi:hypothetical protein
MPDDRSAIGLRRYRVAAENDVMSRGPTRRVLRLMASGVLSPELLAAADHEADLLAHPYIGLEHIELARLRVAGQESERAAMLGELTAGVRTRRWPPRGPSSTLRRRGTARTQAVQRRAQHRDQ